MKNYSIVRVGDEYVVQAGDECILKISSRRRAAKLVSEAAELLDASPAAPLAPEDHDFQGIPDPQGHT